MIQKLNGYDRHSYGNNKKIVMIWGSQIKGGRISKTAAKWEPDGKKDEVNLQGIG